MFGASGKGQGFWVSVCFTTCMYGWEMSCRTYKMLTECIIGHMKWLIYPKLLELKHRRSWFSLRNFKQCCDIHENWLSTDATNSGNIFLQCCPGLKHLVVHLWSRRDVFGVKSHLACDCLTFMIMSFPHAKCFWVQRASLHGKLMLCPMTTIMCGFVKMRSEKSAKEW